MSTESDQAQKLVAAIKQDAYKAFGETVYLDDWAAVNAEYALEESTLHTITLLLGSL